MTNYKPRESALQRKVLSYLKPQRDIWYLNTFGNGIQRSGIPDILLCISGKFVAIELKREDGSGEASGQQLIECDKIRIASGITLISDNYDEIITFIEQIKKSH